MRYEFVVNIMSIMSA